MNFYLKSIELQKTQQMNHFVKFIIVTIILGSCTREWNNPLSPGTDNEPTVPAKIMACYKSITVSYPAGGIWIWGEKVSVGDTISTTLEGNIDNYDIPWCTSYDCCDNSSYNGMSISLHTIKSHESYRLFITGGLKGGSYFTDGFVEIPAGWVIDDIENLSDISNGSNYTILKNRISFHAGTSYGGCVCSDCGRAKLTVIISNPTIK